MQKKSGTEYDEMTNLIKSLKEKSVQVLIFFNFWNVFAIQHYTWFYSLENLTLCNAYSIYKSLQVFNWRTARFEVNSGKIW